MSNKLRMAPVRVGDVVDVTIDRLGYRGEGVARHEGFTLFVDGALPGEMTSVCVARVERSFGVADIVKTHNRSPLRVEAPCPAFGVCGGCQLQHIPYEEQLRFKRQLLVDAFTRIGKFEASMVERIVKPTIGMDHPWRYRNKVLVAAADRGGRFVTGFVEEGTHEPVAIEECLLRPVAHDHLLSLIVRTVEELGITPYDEATGSGDVRSIMVRTSSAGEALIAIATQGERLPHAAELARRLGAFAADGVKIASIVHMAMEEKDEADARSPHHLHQTRSQVRSFPTKQTVLWGVGFLQENVMGLTFQVSAKSFLQVNPLQTEVLYRKTLELAEIHAEDIVLDVYSGIGTISLLAAQRARAVVGIESVEEAVADARANAQANGIHNADFHMGAAEAIIRRFATGGVNGNGQLPDVVILDPPRAGCDAEVLRALTEDAKPRRIVYVSCNPATLARDLRILVDGGYALEEAVPVDMFPQTAHVECCVSLVRRS